MISRLRDELGGECAVVGIMSGSFTQRGEPALLDKSTRAACAIAGGCDLVLELPAPWSMAGAAFFARGGVAIANGLGCVDLLAFGSETGDLPSLLETSERLASEEYAAAVASARAADPAAQTGTLRARVFAELYGGSAHLTGSNDLLALAYLDALRELGSAIRPHVIQRVGEAYNSIEIPSVRMESHASASAIRTKVLAGEDVSAFVPPYTAKALMSAPIHRTSNLDRTVAAFLRLTPPEHIHGRMEISGGIENKLCRAAMKQTTLEGIVAACTERRYSPSRLRRAVFGGMLGYTMSDCEALPLYTVPLAMNERGREVLALARKRASIAILSGASAYRSLSEAGKRQLEAARRADLLHELAKEEKGIPR